MVRKGVKIGCSDVSGQPGKIPCLSPRKMIIFPHLALFSTCPSQKSGTSTHFKITFLESTRIELSLHKVLFSHLEICGFWKDLKITIDNC